MLTPFEAALSYAKRGWFVLPLASVSDGECTCGHEDCGSPGKHPRTKNGLLDATTNEAQIRRWWSRWPEANVGIRTGAESGLVVLDIDQRGDGYGSLTKLQSIFGDLPRTPAVATGGGGMHFYFAHPGGKVESRKIAPGVDVKGDGGYVVAVPSVHASGKRYEWWTTTTVS
jgi:hypothetical protein